MTTKKLKMIKNAEKTLLSSPHISKGGGTVIGAGGFIRANMLFCKYSIINMNYIFLEFLLEFIEKYVNIQL